MIKNFLKFIRGEEEADGDASVAAQEAQVAVAAVLVEVARRDGVYDASERDEIDAMLGEAYTLDVAAAAALRAQGEAAQEQAVDLHRFTRIIKDSVAHEDRVALLERVWRVALADGQRADAENAFLRQLAGLLYVEDKDSAIARRRADARG